MNFLALAFLATQVSQLGIFSNLISQSFKNQGITIQYEILVEEQMVQTVATMLLQDRLQFYVDKQFLEESGEEVKRSVIEHEIAHYVLGHHDARMAWYEQAVWGEFFDLRAEMQADRIAALRVGPAVYLASIRYLVSVHPGNSPLVLRLAVLDVWVGGR